jgi:hypothetical protein
MASFLPVRLHHQWQGVSDLSAACLHPSVNCENSYLFHVPVHTLYWPSDTASHIHLSYHATHTYPDNIVTC